MQPYRIDDPRDDLAKATRWELAAFAKANGVTEITGADMPALMQAKILRARGLTKIPIPPRILGQPEVGAVITDSNSPNTESLDADAALELQWRADQEAKAKAPDVEKMSMTELRKECKARGIKMVRTDNLISLRAKLNVPHAA